MLIPDQTSEHQALIKIALDRLTSTVLAAQLLIVPFVAPEL